MAERLNIPLKVDDSISVLNEIPTDIQLRSREIVAAHRPVDIPDGFEPVCMAGIPGKDHAELNLPVRDYPGGKEARDRRIAELRTIYESDFTAQQQLDVYSFNPEYYRMLKEDREAIRKGDEKRIAEIAQWFKVHYPDI
jgi:hypothetical protein